MSIGHWEPAKNADLTVERLRHLLAQIKRIDGTALSVSLSDEFVRSNSHLMKLGAISWQAAEGLSDDELNSLVRFFTLAEMQLAGWEGGKQSPVIFLVRILKARNKFSAELRKWIKANTDNRYLPYGSAL